MPTLAEIKKFFNKQISTQEAEMAKFRERLSDNAAYAFVWAEGVMRATARAQVAKHYLSSISNWEAAVAACSLSKEQPQNDEEAVEFIRKSVLNQAIRRNAYISRSTSTTSNFMEQEENAFYAYIISEWDFVL